MNISKNIVSEMAPANTVGGYLDTYTWLLDGVVYVQTQYPKGNKWEELHPVAPVVGDFLPLVGGEMAGPITSASSLILEGSVESKLVSGTRSIKTPSVGSNIFVAEDSSDGTSFSVQSSTGDWTNINSAGAKGILSTGFNLTGNRFWKMPNASGTVALDTDLAEKLSIAGGTMTGDMITDKSIKAATGLGYLNLYEGASPNTVLLSTDGQLYNESFVFLDPTSVELLSVNGTFSSNSGETKMRRTGTASVMHLGLSALIMTDSNVVSANEIIISDNTLASYTSAGADRVATMIGSSQSTFNAAVINSVAVAGDLLTVKTNNTLYTNQMSLQSAGVLFDGIVKTDTLSADRSWDMPNHSGQVALNLSGTTLGRPVTSIIGQMYFDTTLTIPVWYSGTNWLDATGTIA